MEITVIAHSTNIGAVLAYLASIDTPNFRVQDDRYGSTGGWLVTGPVDHVAQARAAFMLPTNA